MRARDRSQLPTLVQVKYLDAQNRVEAEPLKITFEVTVAVIESLPMLAVSASPVSVAVIVPGAMPPVAVSQFAPEDDGVGAEIDVHRMVDPVTVIVRCRRR